MSHELIAVVDVGKTHSKLTLLEAESGAVTWSTQSASAPNVKASDGRAGAFRQLDAAGVETWLIESLRSAPGKEAIRAIVPVAHGAAAALLDGKGRLLALPDYEDPVFDSVRERYLQLRDPFCATYSPPLALGLNLGIQLFYLQTYHFELFRQTAAILLYPQYWAWRLSGVMAREVTSLGCHSDLWLPGENRFSQLAAWQGWAELFPPMRHAGDVLGRLTAEMAAATGLDRTCRVLCGIHDSSASFLGHGSRSAGDRPLTVIASGTWTLIMSQGTEIERLRPELDMLANVDAGGVPLATARFMGGREYQMIAGTSDPTALPDSRALQQVVNVQAMALPSFAAAGGPFAGVSGCLLNAEALPSPERTALATLYVALVCDWILKRLGTHGDIMVDGPLASNPLFDPLLAALRPDDRVQLTAGAGTARGAYLLAEPLKHVGIAPFAVTGLTVRGLGEYRAQWRERVKQR